MDQELPLTWKFAFRLWLHYIGRVLVVSLAAWGVSYVLSFLAGTLGGFLHIGNGLESYLVFPVFFLIQIAAFFVVSFVPFVWVLGATIGGARIVIVSNASFPAPSEDKDKIKEPTDFNY